MNEGTALYPAHVLRTGTSWPPDVDPARRERHLQDCDFVAALGVSRDTFAKLAPWRQISLKKECGLF